MERGGEDDAKKLTCHSPKHEEVEGEQEERPAGFSFMRWRHGSMQNLGDSTSSTEEEEEAEIEGGLPCGIKRRVDARDATSTTEESEAPPQEKKNEDEDEDEPLLGKPLKEPMKPRLHRAISQGQGVPPKEDE